MPDLNTRPQVNMVEYDVSNADAKFIAARLIRVLVHAVNKHKLEYSTLRYVHREVIRKTKMSKPRKPKRLHNLVTSEEIDRFLAAINDVQIHLMVRLMLNSGGRVNEITSALVSDINWENNTIKIIGKNDKQRLLIMSARIAESLKLFLHGKKHRYIFENRLGRRFSVRMVELYFRRFKTAAGITKPFAPHDTRRYLFTKLSEHPNGLDLAVRCMMAGHSEAKSHRPYILLGYEGVLPQIRDALQNLESKNILK